MQKRIHEKEEVMQNIKKTRTFILCRYIIEKIKEKKKKAVTKRKMTSLEQVREIDKQSKRKHKV